MPELRDLALFVSVVDSGSITTGAQSEGLSLSAASTRISGLERDHGVQLLSRGRRGVTPTPVGEVLAEHARRVLAETLELERTMAAHGKGLRHQIRLASNSSAVDTLTEFLAATLAHFPETTIMLSETSSPEALQRVATATADIAVVSQSPKDDRLELRELWADPLVVVGAEALRGHGLDSDKTSGLSLSAVLTSPLIGLSEGNPLQTLIDRKATELGTTPAYRVRLPSFGAVYAVASTGAGPAIIPRATARRLGVADSDAPALTEPWAQRQAYLVARDFRSLSPTVAQFADALLRYRSEAEG